MDRYTKFILTVIAISLSAIALILFELPQAQAGVFSQGPTRGDFIALRGITDPALRKAARDRLFSSIPLVWVQGGDVDVSGSVEIDSLDSPLSWRFLTEMYGGAFVQRRN